jgi:hypothetical protein
MGGLLIEMDNDRAANWMKNTKNAENFCKTIGPNAKFKIKTYSLITYNVPISMDPDNNAHIEEIQEVNQLERGTIKWARWVKPITRRSRGQRSAHLIPSFTDTSAANHVLVSGLTICHHRIRIDKVKKEPIHCLKCQKWNHYARECPAEHNTCSNCAGPHRSAQCQDPSKRRCISCDTDNHASWSRECGTFLRKVNECNCQHPENALPFIPSSEPWTWTTGHNDNAQTANQAQTDIRGNWDWEIRPTNEPEHQNTANTKHLWSDEVGPDDFISKF